jgi:hypothetical protein
MSYTTQDARAEWSGFIDEVLKTRDVEAAFQIRDEFARMGDEEQAEWWDAQARRWENEDWAHDRNNDNRV